MAPSEFWRIQPQLSRRPSGDVFGYDNIFNRLRVKMKTDPFAVKLYDLVHIPPVRAEADVTFAQAVEKLRSREAGALVLCEDDVPKGIFTKCDFRKRCALESVAPETPIRDLMTPDPATIPMDATIGEAIALINRRKVRSLPIVDRVGKLVGVLTIGRLVRFLANNISSTVVNMPPRPFQVADEVEGA